MKHFIHTYLLQGRDWKFPQSSCAQPKWGNHHYNHIPPVSRHSRRAPPLQSAFFVKQFSEEAGTVTESGIENGMASFTFQATENGTIKVEAQFETGGVLHKVISLAHLICT